MCKISKCINDMSIEDWVSFLCIKIFLLYDYEVNLLRYIIMKESKFISIFIYLFIFVTMELTENIPPNHDGILHRRTSDRSFYKTPILVYFSTFLFFGLCPFVIES